MCTTHPFSKHCHISSDIFDATKLLKDNNANKIENLKKIQVDVPPEHVTLEDFKRVS